MTDETPEFPTRAPSEWSPEAPDASAPDPSAGPVQPPRARGWRRGVALVGAIGLVGGGAFAARQFAASPSNTPTEAVQQFLGAIGNSDVIGAMETLAPGERDLMLDTAVPLIEELKRLDVIDASNDLRKLESAQLKFIGQAFAEQPVRDDIVTVQMTGGSVESSADPSKIAGGVVEQFQDSLPTVQKTSEPFEKGSLTTVKRSGRWYVSLAYTGAEAARRSSGKPMPALAASIAPAGAASAEEAVKQMMDRLGALDTTGAISLLDPDEMQVLQDYAPLFLADAEQSLASARKQFTLTFPNLGLASKQVDGRTVVSITKWSVDLNVTADGQAGRLLVDGDCVDVTYDGKQSKRCGKDLPKLIGDITGDTAGTSDIEKQWVDQYQKALSDPAALGGITVVERNGKWYVAPMRTAFGSVVSSLRKVKPEDLKGTGKTPEERLSSLMENPLFGQISGPVGAIIGAPLGAGTGGFTETPLSGSEDPLQDFPGIDIPAESTDESAEIGSPVSGTPDSTMLFDEPVVGATESGTPDGSAITLP